MFQNRSNSERLFIAFVLLIVVSTIVNTAPQLFVLLAIMAAFYFYQHRDDTSDRDGYNDADDWDVERQEPRPRPVRRERPSNVEQIHQHALRAVRAAGLNPDEIKVLPVDMGLIAFQGEDAPSIHRNTTVPDESDYIQPFAELRVPVNATGKIRFEVYDRGRRQVFVHEDYHELKRGRNLVSPSGRLPIHDELDTDGNWELRISADNVVLSRHVFQWAASDEIIETEDEDGGLRDHIREDGEISNELRAMMADSRLDSMSLDELLAFQDEDEQQSGN